MNGSVFIKVAQQGEPDGEAEEADNSEKLYADKHAAKGNDRMQADLTPYDFWLQDIPDNGDHHIDDQQTQGQGIISALPICGIMIPRES